MTRNRTADFFNSYSAEFDSIYGNRGTFADKIINRLFRKSMRIRYEMTIAGCRPIVNKSVLDIGCGPGHYGIALARNGAARVVGVDFSEKMIALARQNARAAGVENKCEFITGDFLDYSADEKFDYSMAIGFMDYIPNAREALIKMLSLTDGRAFISFPVREGFLAWQRNIRYKRRCDLYTYSRPQLDKLLSDLPARNIWIEKISRDYFVTITPP
jgi:SAM-dependent methyltransferase